MVRFRSKTLANAFRVQESYNKKIKRLQRTSSNTNLLPSTISNKQLVELINNVESSRDLQREIKKMERFIKRGGEKIITYKGEEMLQSDKENLISAKLSAMGRLRGEINLELEKIGNPISYKELVDRPKLAHFYGTEIGNAMTKLQNVKNANGGKTYNQMLYEKFTRDSARWKDFRNNFIQMIEDTAYLYGIPKSEVDAVKEQLKKLSGRNFAVAYRKNPWIEHLVVGYHVYMEFALSQNFNTEIQTQNFLKDWQSFKESIKVVVNEELENVVDFV